MKSCPGGCIFNGYCLSLKDFKIHTPSAQCGNLHRSQKDRELLARPKQRQLKKINSGDPTHRATVTKTGVQVATSPLDAGNDKLTQPLIPRHFPPTAVSPVHSLRPYQEECVDTCLKAISEGKRYFHEFDWKDSTC